MPWMALPREDIDIWRPLATKYEVKGVPVLVMLNAKTGEVLSKNCIQKLEKTGPMAVSEFMEKC